MGAEFRVAIIGCGWAGSRHAHAFAGCGVRLAWAVDLDHERAARLAGGAGQTSADYRDALADPAVDAVSICLPHHLHAPVAIAAARARKHILVEKPLAATLDEADAMIAAAADAAVVLMVAENVRFAPVFLQVRDLIAEGVIGQPALVQLTREAYLRHSFIEERPWFLNAHAAAGGMMMSGGVHDFEKLRMILGEIVDIHARRARQRFMEMEGDDTSIASVRFASGAVGVLVESFLMKSQSTAAGAEVHTLRIDGDLGSLWVPDEETIRIFSERADYLVDGRGSEHTIHISAQDTFRLEIEHFIECLCSGQEPITSGRSQRRPLELVLAAYRSMTSGLPVNVTGGTA